MDFPIKNGDFPSFFVGLPGRVTIKKPAPIPPQKIQQPAGLCHKVLAIFSEKTGDFMVTRPGKPTKNYGKIHNF